MIADLVRNDLSKVAVEGTVKVEQLCEIYSFMHVHQMISTITVELDPAKSDVEAIKQTFPMGSMTGAPKHSAVQLAEKYESFQRGLYSGSVGYFAPNGNFDFNVVIRSILYNAENKTISIAAGSAITAQCESEKEYDECLLKAEALIKILFTTSSSSKSNPLLHL
jgi:para-aminobenzoate synthetase component 1